MSTRAAVPSNRAHQSIWIRGMRRKTPRTVVPDWIESGVKFPGYKFGVSSTPQTFYSKYKVGDKIRLATAGRKTETGIVQAMCITREGEMLTVRKPNSVRTVLYCASSISGDLIFVKN